MLAILFEADGFVVVYDRDEKGKWSLDYFYSKQR
jgi:hypothetical protein